MTSLDDFKHLSLKDRMFIELLIFACFKHELIFARFDVVTVVTEKKKIMSSWNFKPYKDGSILQMEAGHSPEYLSHNFFFFNFRALSKCTSIIDVVTEAIMGHGVLVWLWPYWHSLFG